jgi:hypothetical protein
VDRVRLTRRRKFLVRLIAHCNDEIVLGANPSHLLSARSK